MNNLSDLLTIETNNITPKKGHILISEPFLNDHYFKRSVVLLAEHNDEGSFGIIMNKPVDAGFNEMVKDFPDFESKMFLGGPVKTDSLFFIHTLGDKVDGSAVIQDGLYWGGDIEQIKEMITLKLIKPHEIRFYVGYSGWAPKQLEQELKRNSWVVSKMKSESLLITDPDELWKESLRYLGEKYSLWGSFPSEPAFN